MIAGIVVFVLYVLSIWIAFRWILGGVLELDIDDLDPESPEERQSFERCIMAPYKHVTSMCGRDISTEFHFVSADHWLKNREMEGRIVACRSCAAVLQGHIADEQLILKNSKEEN